MSFLIAGEVSSIDEADEIEKITKVFVLGKRIRHIGSLSRIQTETFLPSPKVLFKKE